MRTRDEILLEGTEFDYDIERLRLLLEVALDIREKLIPQKKQVKDLPESRLQGDAIKTIYRIIEGTRHEFRACCWCEELGQCKAECLANELRHALKRAGYAIPDMQNVNFKC
jgi:hypothetical protein